ncbi:uncharacterized protein LOC124121515 [Haliotis rufescens]|uniref:uncharacterized protein LOC124121515 n=1 Tax=Haliotis rufescens TaxID=6454 RepID=UPI00201ED634|nr:uncharacterized protein LOC124121515 [Haliotis rufescens]
MFDLVLTSVIVLVWCADEVQGTCPVGTYGVDCDYRCNCPPNTCNSSSGCTSGDCYPGWSGPTCHKRNILLNLTESAFTSSPTHLNTPPHRAADGRVAATPEHINSCFFTNNTGANYTWWRADLENRTLMNDVTISFRKDFKARRNGIQVFVTNSVNIPSGHNCYNVTGNGDGTDVPDVLHITCYSRGRYLLLYTTTINNDQPEIITPMMDFCEVEVNECEHGRYGLTCSTDCRLRECRGDSSRCDQVTGECVEGCRGGYRGPDCMRPCEEGHYGANCSRKCDDRHCKHPDASCNHVTGECVHNCSNPGTGGVKNQTCRPGWQGLDCVAECSSGTFGDKCSGSCGACLDSELCHRVNGTCPRGCSEGWSGHLCKQKCPLMTYGANCSETCGACRDNDTCDLVNGRCLRGCREGWTGEFCISKQDTGEIPVRVLWIAGASGGGLLLIALLVLIAIVVTRTSKGRESVANHPEMKLKQMTASVDETLAPTVIMVDNVHYVGFSGTGNTAQDGADVKLDIGRGLGLSGCEDGDDGGRRGSTEVEGVEGVSENLVVVTAVSEGFGGDIYAVSNRNTGSKPTGNDDGEKIVDVEEVNAEVEEVDGDVDHQEMEDHDGDSTYYNLEGPPLITEVGVDKLGDRIKEMQATKYGFQKEFRMLFTGFTRPYDVSQQTDNTGKNRFLGCYPYDYNRVLLPKLAGHPSSDYINASYFDGYSCSQAYVAAQAPNKKTLCDFWRMIWENNCTRIIMLTNILENEKVRCEPYWSDSSDLDVGLFAISVTKTAHSAQWTMRELTATLKETGNSRQFRQFHFTSWSDRGVSGDTALTEFMWRVRKAPNPQQSPLLVHCSAGVGRTGTYIAVDNLLDQALTEDRVDVFGFVSRMRDQRKGMVQTKEQYERVYTTLQAALTHGDTTMTVSEFRHNRINQRMFTMGSVDVSSYVKSVNTGSKTTKELSEQGRISRQCDVVSILSPSFKSMNGYLLVDTTFITAASQFWQLVDLNQALTIVVLLEDFKILQDIILSPGNSLDLSQFSVMCSTENIINHDIIMRNIQQKKEGSSSWTNIQVYLANHLTVAAYPFQMDLLASREDTATPVTVVFNETTTRQAALFCIISNILQRVKQDGEVEIFNNMKVMANLLHYSITQADVCLCFDVAAASLDCEDWPGGITM